MEIKSQQCAMDGRSTSAMIQLKKHKFDTNFANLGIFWDSEKKNNK